MYYLYPIIWSILDTKWPRSLKSEHFWGCHFLFEKMRKGFSKFIQGKNWQRFNFLFIFKQFFSQNLMNGCDCWGPDGRLDTNIDQIEICHISMSYSSYVIIRHFMSYDPYVIKICHQSIWAILVSKWPSGAKQSHPFIRFWLTNCLKIKKNKKCVEIFFPL